MYWSCTVVLLYCCTSLYYSQFYKYWSCTVVLLYFVVLQLVLYVLVLYCCTVVLRCIIVSFTCIGLVLLYFAVLQLVLHASVLFCCTSLYYNQFYMYWSCTVVLRCIIISFTCIGLLLLYCVNNRDQNCSQRLLICIGSSRVLFLPLILTLYISHTCDHQCNGGGAAQLLPKV